jgi:hypothetical protein
VVVGINIFRKQEWGAWEDNLIEKILFSLTFFIPIGKTQILFSFGVSNLVQSEDEAA